eukprot:scaffold53788_cov13-Tisochrysis_lutea.AAC.1
MQNRAQSSKKVGQCKEAFFLLLLTPDRKKEGLQGVLLGQLSCSNKQTASPMIRTDSLYRKGE